MTTNRLTNTLLRISLLLLAAFAARTALAQPGTATGQYTPPPPPKPTPERLLDLGRLDGVNYSNDFFGLSLSIPRDWVVVSAQRNREVVEQSKQILRSEDQRKQAQANSSFERSTLLLSLTKLPAGQPANAAFMLIAERIPTPAIKTGADVLRSMESLAKGTNFTVEFQGGIRTEQIGGAEFGVATIKNTSPYGVYMQKAYVTTKDGYALQLFYTYLDDADLPAFDAIIKSLRLK